MVRMGRDLDICLLAGVDCSPSDVLELLKRVVELPGFVGFTWLHPSAAPT